MNLFQTTPRRARNTIWGNSCDLSGARFWLFCMSLEVGTAELCKNQPTKQQQQPPPKRIVEPLGRKFEY